MTHYIRWFPHPTNEHTVCGMYSGSDHNLVDCEIEHWVHTLRGDVYEPILIVRAYQNGRSTMRRVRIEDDGTPYMIHSLSGAKAVLDEYYGCTPETKAKP